jgi:hypothetical protein
MYIKGYDKYNSKTVTSRMKSDFNLLFQENGMAWFGVKKINGQ